MLIEKKEALIFHQTVNAGQEISLEHVVKSDGRIKKIRVQFIDGPDGDLKVYPRLKNVSGDLLPMIDFVGDDNFLSGNASEFLLNLDVPVKEKFVIEFIAKNEEQVYSYPMIADVEIEYCGGE